MRVRPKADPQLGWAFRPDSDTNAALKRGLDKFKRNHRKTGHVLGADRPHYGGNLAEALETARKAESKRRGTRSNRRRRMARKLNLKELDALRKGKLSSKGSSKKKTKVAAPSGKMIPLKVICSELELDPKATRVKLRRLIAKGEIDFHDPSSRWEFTKAQANVIRQALS